MVIPIKMLQWAVQGAQHKTCPLCACLYSPDVKPSRSSPHASTSFAPASSIAKLAQPTKNRKAAAAAGQCNAIQFHGLRECNPSSSFTSMQLYILCHMKSFHLWFRTESSHCNLIRVSDADSRAIRPRKETCRSSAIRQVGTICEDKSASKIIWILAEYQGNDSPHLAHNTDLSLQYHTDHISADDRQHTHCTAFSVNPSQKYEYHP